MRKVELIKKTQREFDSILENPGIESLKIWNCKIHDYSKLSSLQHLLELEIFIFDKGKLSDLSELKQLKKLRLIHIPQIQDLSELSHLANLEELSLESLPSWDSSGKTLVFNNLEPISALSKLKMLTLMKAKVHEMGLQPLEQLHGLEEFVTDNTFSIQDFARLSAYLPHTSCKYFHPFHKVNSKCNTCDSQKVRLSGVSRGGLICPQCSSKKLNEHIEAFNHIKASVR
ncbi:hypothetical protein [Paenibacillus sp. 1001270B_150601_E10]|uniref:hypothetical protein n=1 Tax=Paenibacillus sp. 1001270B_150601_E10 TaxID=2787079 RepID=UPI00189F0B25|nr:hypothetical protein [Paenibacillus sp. 1001270B_150601_E10]